MLLAEPYRDRGRMPGETWGTTPYQGDRRIEAIAERGRTAWQAWQKTPGCNRRTAQRERSGEGGGGQHSEMVAEHRDREKLRDATMSRPAAVSDRTFVAGADLLRDADRLSRLAQNRAARRSCKVGRVRRRPGYSGFARGRPKKPAAASDGVNNPVPQSLTRRSPSAGAPRSPCPFFPVPLAAGDGRL